MPTLGKMEGLLGHKSGALDSCAAISLESDTVLSDNTSKEERLGSIFRRCSRTERWYWYRPVDWYASRLGGQSLRLEA